jgi:multidrug resistance protein, MATE family
MQKAVGVKAVQKRIFQLATPAALSSLGRVACMFIATLFVARLGSLPLAALGLGYIFAFSLQLFCNGCMLSITMLCGQYIGEKDDKAVARVIGQSLLQALLLSGFGVLLLVNAHPIFLLLGQNPAVASLAANYCKAYAIGLPFTLLLVAFRQLFLALSDVSVINAYAVLNLAFNFFGFYYCYSGVLGLPIRGMVGVGYVQSIAGMLLFIMALIYFHGKKQYNCYRFHRKILPVCRKTLGQLFGLGFPVAISMSLEITVMLILSIMLGVINRYALASYQIVSQLAFFVLMIPISFAQSLTVITSLRFGANNFGDLIAYIMVAIAWSFGLMLVCSLLFFIVPKSLIHLILHDPIAHEALVIHYAVTMLAIVGVYQLFESIRLVFIGVLRGLKDVRAPMFISFCSSLVLGVTVAYVLGFYFHYGVVGVWFALIPALFLSLVMTAVRLYQQFKKYYVNFYFNSALKSLRS